MREPSTLAICIPTFKRPVLLKQCLLAIGELNLPENLNLLVIVVDNDREQEGKEVCDNISSSLDQPLHYYVETERGLCSVRNCLIEKAREHEADLIAFIDDDEMPHKDWLRNLHDGLVTHSVDIATGPVIPTIEVTPPAEFVMDLKYKTGVTPRYISTNNVIFSKRLISELGLTFDLYYNFIGGEDFDFFGRASKLGCTATWVNEAVIFEAVLPERETLRYKLFRHYTGGINNVLRYKKTYSAFAAWLHFIPKTLGKFIGAVLSLIRAIVNKHRHNLEKAGVKFASGMGYCAGLLNIIHERYRY
ncbi:MAG: succinoglycan biosynthesis protein ExoM [Gammaproteobacteria bacterium]|jgi:succinoglycan biosynthesis protein ExoM